MIGPESVTVVNHYSGIKRLIRQMRALDELAIHYTVETTQEGYKLTYVAYANDGSPHGVPHSADAA